MFAYSIRHFLNLASVFGSFPFCNYKNDKFTRNNIYQLVLIVITLIVFIACNFNSYRKLNRESDNIQWVYFGLRLMNLFSQLHFALSSNYVKLPQTQRLFDLFDEIDKQLVCEGYKNSVGITGVLTKFLITNLFMWILFTYDFVMLGIVMGKMHLLPLYISEWINYYALHIIEAIKLIVLYSVRKRYVAINTHLMSVEFNMAVDRGDVDRIDGVIHLHEMVAELIQLTNQIFGWNFLFSSVQMILYFLCFTKLQLESGVFEWQRSAFMIVWTAYNMIQTVAVAAMCEKVNDEGTKTITIAYKTLARYINIAYIRERLFIFAQQCTALYPQFSAVGFFNVDFAMLFTFINLITTYVIVVIQFSNNVH